jgi:hypothetical protein
MERLLGELTRLAEDNPAFIDRVVAVLYGQPYDSPVTPVYRPRHTDVVAWDGTLDRDVILALEIPTRNPNNPQIKLAVGQIGACHAETGSWFDSQVVATWPLCTEFDCIVLGTHDRNAALVYAALENEASVLAGRDPTRGVRVCGVAKTGRVDSIRPAIPSLDEFIGDDVLGTTVVPGVGVYVHPVRRPLVMEERVHPREILKVGSVLFVPTALLPARWN